MTSLTSASRRNKALAFSLALGLALAPAIAEAKAGGGFSFGSRGTRTYTAPPVTNTAPRSAAPIERSMSPQTAPSSSFAQRPAPSSGFFGGAFGRGLLGGFIGAGLFGMLFGHGLMGGLGDLMSIFGLLLQLALVFMLARFAWNWIQNRQQPALAGASPRQTGGPSMDRQSAGPYSSGPSFGGGGAASAPATTPLKVEPVDFNVFERRLSEIQAAYGAEDRAALAQLTTPEMAGYFDEQFADNARKGLINRISGVTLLQGDLSEAWREAAGDHASVAMRFSLIDTMHERASGRLVSGDAARPTETTEIWTFVRPRGAGVDAWVLSAIQQA